MLKMQNHVETRVSTCFEEKKAHKHAENGRVVDTMLKVEAFSAENAVVRNPSTFQHFVRAMPNAP